MESFGRTEGEKEPITVMAIKAAASASKRKNPKAQFIAAAVPHVAHMRSRACRRSSDESCLPHCIVRKGKQNPMAAPNMNISGESPRIMRHAIRTNPAMHAEYKKGTMDEHSAKGFFSRPVFFAAQRNIPADANAEEASKGMTKSPIAPSSFKYCCRSAMLGE
ncbi:MAG: hypothetical protein Q4B69_02550 [Slackia sp.]|nr:hypothetical protein [Slackia sp.]